MQEMEAEHYVKYFETTSMDYLMNQNAELESSTITQTRSGTNDIFMEITIFVACALLFLIFLFLYIIINGSL